MKKVFTIILMLGLIALCVCAIRHWGFFGIMVASCICGLTANITTNNTEVGE